MSKKTKYYRKGRSMDFAHIFFNYFFETDYMHFGYWTSDLDVKFANLKHAQDNYAKQLLDLIPSDVESILEVGCGSGKMAEILLDKGYQVDIVSPPNNMTDIAQSRVGDRANFFELKYEDFTSDQQYDLILFSESFQFVSLAQSLKQCQKHTRKYVLIADVFKRDRSNKGPIGGGHDYNEYQQQITDNHFSIKQHNDVTGYIAPTFDLEHDLFQHFVKPTLTVAQRAIETQNWLTRVCIKAGLWFKRKQLQKLSRKYLDSDDRNASSFERYKIYCFDLLEKTN